MYAYSPHGVVSDLVDDLPDYHPDLVAQYARVPSAVAADVQLGWTFDGQTYQPPVAVEPPPENAVPATVSSAQAKIMLRRTAGSAPGKSLLEEAVALVEAGKGTDAGDEIAIWYAEARSWERGNAYVAQVGEALGLSATQIDGLFRDAARIEA